MRFALLTGILRKPGNPSFERCLPNYFKIFNMREEIGFSAEKPISSRVLKVFGGVWGPAKRGVSKRFPNSSPDYFGQDFPE
jgi:hypothetical protein